MGFQACALALTATLLLGGCATSLPEPCREKPSSGRCHDSVTRFYYDSGWGECRAFIWGGCGGNAPFDTMEACTGTCNAPASDLWQHRKNAPAGDAAGP